jgi:hypothetical protein
MQLSSIVWSELWILCPSASYVYITTLKASHRNSLARQRSASLACPLKVTTPATPATANPVIAEMNLRE